ncbi:TetR/AcrR family transcriptional regulator [Brevundimonas naejangsanensis]|uniref:TetR/AcrR family transcriptional regulator n=1 Tax=Brevundimonas naejangsanensis TaxID=588932 RepID=A0A494RR69_9CAUL|nr:TetR/AcrR family transcriptional regulator [Brevundimonas naejangsanensis]
MGASTRRSGAGGRPRKYDPESALRSAMDLFRMRGFASPSMADLARAAGVHRPSLSAAFGDRKSLYLAAIELFRSDLRSRGEATLAQPNIRLAVKAFFDAIIDVYAGGDNSAPGCLVFCTTPAEAAHDPEIRAVLAATLDEVDTLLAERLGKAEGEGQLIGAAHGLAPLLAALLHSLAIRARAGEGPARLREIAEIGIDQLLSVTPTGATR